MPRVARIVVPGLPHHITQHGNNRQDVFFVDDDRRAYLRLLKERCDAAGVAEQTSVTQIFVAPDHSRPVSDGDFVYVGRRHDTSRRGGVPCHPWRDFEKVSARSTAAGG